jgi:hypothetical protein
MRGHKTLKGGFLNLLFMLHDYKASAVNPHARNKKPDTTLVVVSLKSLHGACCRNKRDEDNIATPKVQNAGSKKVVELPSSNKHLGDHPYCQVGANSSPSGAMSQRLHGPLHGSRAILSSPARKSPSSTSCWRERHQSPPNATDPKRVVYSKLSYP